MNRIIRPAAIRRSVTVSASAPLAFETFTARIHTWWPRSNHIGTADLKTAVLEPRVGGRWYEIGTDGSECDWGRVLVWDPPFRLVLNWQIDNTWQYNPALVTEVEIRFLEDGPHTTRVELEHRKLENFGAYAEQMRSSFESPRGWSGILEKYVSRASSDIVSSG